jgi:S1-C subfamily serine protease
MTTSDDNRDKLKGLNQQIANEPRSPSQTSSPSPRADSTTTGNTITPDAVPLPQTPTTTKGVSPLARTVFIALAVVGVFFTVGMVWLLVAPGTSDEPVMTEEQPLESQSEDMSDGQSVTESAPSGTSDEDIFDRPADIPDLISSVSASTVLIWCEADESMGSGFILNLQPLIGTPDEVIVTNHHVVVGCLSAGTVEVELGNQIVQAEILGWDQSADLAVVQAADVKAPALTANVNAETGQWVMAVGAPEGVENSVSFGAVTNVGSDSELPDFQLLTSDAVIGPGSSGGPLVDNQGRVLAANFAVWDEARGISLARPLEDLCVQILECR